MKTDSVFNQKELAKGIIEGDKIILQEVKSIMLLKIKGMLVKRQANFKLLDQKAVDIFQDAIYGFLAAVRTNQYIEQGRFLSFLMEIAANAASKNFHGRRKLGEASVSGNGHSGEAIDYMAGASCNFFDTLQDDALDLEELIDLENNASENQNLLRTVQAESNNLKPQHKVVFDLWVDGYSVAKTAELLDLSTNNVKVIRSRLRNKLRMLCN